MVGELAGAGAGAGAGVGVGVGVGGGAGAAATVMVASTPPVPKQVLTPSKMAQGPSL